MSVRGEEALFLKKLECQIINIEEMMELETQHFATIMVIIIESE